MSIDKQAFVSLLRSDFLSFVAKVFAELHPGQKLDPSWYIGAVADLARRIIEGDVHRGIVCLPPRHLKSIILSVALPAFYLGLNPHRKVICVSYGQELASTLTKSCAQVMQSAWYKEAFPQTVLEKITELDLQTTKNGRRYAVTTHGALTGIGGDLIIIDDPMKASDVSSQVRREQNIDWLCTTLLSRLDDQVNGSILVTMQRLHQEDLVGHLLDQGGWEYLAIPAESQISADYVTGPSAEDVHRYEKGEVLDPARQPKHILDEMRAQMGHGAFSAQYLQEPLPDGRCLFDWAWFRIYDLKNPPAFDLVFQSWDVASSVDSAAAYSVCTTWGVAARLFFLIDVDRRRLPIPDLIRHAQALYATYQPNIVLVEATGIGEALYQSLRERYAMRVCSHKPTTDKVTRAEKQTVRIESGQVFVPESAPWLPDFHREITAFPQGKFQDQVDSMVGFLTHAEVLIRRVDSFGLHHRGSGHAGPEPSRYREQYPNWPRLVSY